MLSSRDHLEAQAYERRRVLAAFLGNPRVLEVSPWRPVSIGALVTGVLMVVSVALQQFG